MNIIFRRSRVFLMAPFHVTTFVFASSSTTDSPHRIVSEKAKQLTACHRETCPPWFQTCCDHAISKSTASTCILYIAPTHEIPDPTFPQVHYCRGAQQLKPHEFFRPAYQRLGSRFTWPHAQSSSQNFPFVLSENMSF